MGKERNTEPSWYSGTIQGYEEVDTNGLHVLAGSYIVASGGGDEPGDLEEIHIKIGEDFLF